MGKGIWKPRAVAIDPVDGVVAGNFEIAGGSLRLGLVRLTNYLIFADGFDLASAWAR